MKISCMSSEEIISSLSFAVLPIDDFTGERPPDNLSISIKELKIDGVQNTDGYYLFFDLDNSAKYTLQIKADSDNYANSTEIIDLALLYQDPTFKKNPKITIKLIPNSSYPFPMRSTLIRGTVEIPSAQNDIFGTEKIPVTEAIVKIPKLNLAVKPDKNGEFLFYFTNLRTDNIIEEELPDTGKKRYIKTIDNSSLFTLRVEHPEYKLFQKSNNKAEVGLTTIVNAQLKPK